MPSFPIRTCWAAVLLGHTWFAAAQTSPTGAPMKPAAIVTPAARPQAEDATRPRAEDAKAPVPPVQHRSALRGAPAVAAVPVESWSNANRVVDQVGGWRAYLKEAHGLPASAEKGK